MAALVPWRRSHDAGALAKAGLPIAACGFEGMAHGPARTDTPPGKVWVDQAYRAIRTGQLHALLRVHLRPINVVVSHGSQARPGFEGGFPLRCLQRLSRPYIATRLCRWRDNRSTRGTSTPVLSY